MTAPGEANPIDRARLRTTFADRLEQIPFCRALWEGGSTAWHRDDEWSDLDLMVLVDDGRIDETLSAIRAILEELGTVEHWWRLPEPTWHGHAQVFAMLREAGPHVIFDIVIVDPTAEVRFDERERHGEPLILFDKHGEVTAPPLDRARHAIELTSALERLRVTFPLFQGLVDKEIRRGSRLAAVAAYHALTLHPLNTLLRIRHCPDRFDYDLKYASVDLPPEVADRLEGLAFAADLEELATAHRRAVAWFDAVLAELAENDAD